MKQSDVSKLNQWAEKLKMISTEVSYHERMKWAIDNAVSLQTVNRYLKGQGTSIPFSDKLYNDLKKIANVK